MFVFESKEQPLNRIRPRLHGGVDELADVVQSAGFDVKHIGCRVADDFRFAALGIAIVGIERVTGGFDLVTLAKKLFDFTHHAREFLGILFRRFGGISRLGNDPDVDLRLVRFHGYDGFAIGRD